MDESFCLRLGVLTDVHWGEPPGARAGWHNQYDFAGLAARLEEAKRLFAARPVDAICVLGDLTHGGATSALRDLGACLQDLGVPAFVVGGNHDAGGPDALAAELPALRLAERAGVSLGAARVAGIHATAGTWFAVRTIAPPATDAWGDEPTVLLSHYPVLSHAQRLAARGMPHPGDLVDRADIAAGLTARSAPTIVLSGHIHTRDTLIDGDVLQLTQAALVEAPYECSVIEIAGGDELVLVRQAYTLSGPAPEGPYTPVLVPPRESFAHGPGGWRELSPTLDRDRLEALS